MLRLLLPILAGVLLGMYIQVSLLLCMCVALSACLVYVYASKRKSISNTYSLQWIYGACLQLMSCMAGCGLVTAHNPVNDPAYFMHGATAEDLFMCRVQSVPQTGLNSIRLDVEVIARINAHSSIPVNGRSFVYVRRDSINTFDAVYGDVFYLPNVFDVPDPPKNPGAFDFGKYLRQQGIHHIAFVSADALISSKVNDAQYQWQFIFAARNYFHDLLEQYIADADIRAVGEAMVIGSRTDISDDIRQAYANTGTMHILAVSGLHVGILYAVLAFLLTPVRWLHHTQNGRMLMCAILLLIIWWYACLAGLSASVNRSAVMFSFLSLGKLWERESNTFNTLFASMLVLIIFDPFCITQVGFQLSYLAVGGIIFFQPYFQKVLRPKKWLWRNIYAMCSVSIAAQLATLPLTLYYFHQFPNYFLLSNLLAIPVSFVVLVLGLVFFAFGGIGLLAPLIAWVFDLSLQIMNGVVLAVDRLPFAVSNNILLTGVGMGCLYACLFFIGWSLATLRIRLAIIALWMLVCFGVYQVAYPLKEARARQLVIYSTKEHPLMSYHRDGESTLFSNVPSLHGSVDLTNVLVPALVSHGGVPATVVDLMDTATLRGSGWAVRYPWCLVGEEQIFLLDSTSVHQLPKSSPQTTKLWIRGNPWLDLPDLRKRFPEALLLLDNSSSYKRRRYYASAGKKAGFDVHSLPDSGALVLRER